MHIFEEKGRDREGFKPLDTEERDGMLDDDSDSEVYFDFASS